jgi:protein phosphatase
VKIEAAGITDRGSVRENNEDAFLCDADLGLFLVADGMGGLADGEYASALAVEAVAAEVRRARSSEDAAPDFWERRFAQAVSAANAAIREKTGARGGQGLAGSTLAGLVSHGDSFVLANVGDSRAYLVRDGRITQLSEDHSLVMAKVRQGLITREEAAVSPERNAIYRALGMEDRVETDVSRHETRPGDVFLLCTDGLSGVLGDDALLRIVREGGGKPLAALCRELLDRALALTARDNVTVALIRRAA